MIRTLALLCLIAAPAFGLFDLFGDDGLFGRDTSFDKGYKVRFDANLLSYGRSSFMDQPLSRTLAEKNGWEVKASPNKAEGFASLVLLCPKGDLTLCQYYDENGNPAGFQIAFNTEQFTDSIYPWETQGYTYWTVDNNGVTENYWTHQLYFGSPDYYKKSSETRLAEYDDAKLLQDTVIYASGINGALHAISTDPKVIANTALSNFTQQACMLFMGHHYYYLMTEETKCNDQLFPWFPLVYKGKLVGMGHVAYGKYTIKKGAKNVFEIPPRMGVQLIVPHGPQCMYDLADSPGLVTMHTYFIKNPTKMTCLFD